MSNLYQSREESLADNSMQNNGNCAGDSFTDIPAKNKTPKLYIGVFGIFAAAFFMQYSCTALISSFSTLGKTSAGEILIIALISFACFLSFLITFLSAINHLSGNNISKNKSLTLVFGILILITVLLLLVTTVFSLISNIAQAFIFISNIPNYIGIILTAVFNTVLGVSRIKACQDKDSVYEKRELRKLLLGVILLFFGALFAFTCLHYLCNTILQLIYYGNNSYSFSSSLFSVIVRFFIYLICSGVFIVCGIGYLSQKLLKGREIRIVFGILSFIVVFLLFIAIIFNIVDFFKNLNFIKAHLGVSGNSYFLSTFVSLAYSIITHLLAIAVGMICGIHLLTSRRESA